MARLRPWLLLGLFTVAWFLPIFDGPDYTPDPRWLPGLDAFIVALGLRDGGESVLSVASALTNFLMLPAVLWLKAAPTRPAPRWSGLLLGGAALLNLGWAVPAPGGFDPLDLGPGYWLWLLSFALASALLFRSSRARHRPAAV